MPIIAQITLTVLAAYGAYTVSDELLDLSGVLACVALGLWVAAKGRHRISSAVVKPMHTVWCVRTGTRKHHGMLVPTSTWCDIRRASVSACAWQLLMYGLVFGAMTLHVRKQAGSYAGVAVRCFVWDT